MIKADFFTEKRVAWWGRRVAQGGRAEAGPGTRVSLPCLPSAALYLCTTSGLAISRLPCSNLSRHLAHAIVLLKRVSNLSVGLS